MHERWQGHVREVPQHRASLEVLRQEAPERSRPTSPRAGRRAPICTAWRVPHGTTILAVRYADGVVVAGDRQATEGYQVAHRRIEKVYKTDDHSAIAIAGAAGPSIEMARLFQTELEHYEKVEGTACRSRARPTSSPR